LLLLLLIVTLEGTLWTVRLDPELQKHALLTLKRAVEYSLFIVFVDDWVMFQLMDINSNPCSMEKP